MNRTFKVAKSLTRGTVVTSEKASSYQGKAVKTVVAAAVAALVAGTAMAATGDAATKETPAPKYAWTTQEGITNATISTEVKFAEGNTLVSSGDALTIADGGKVSLTDGQHIGVAGSDSEKAKGVIKVSGGDVSVDGASGIHAKDFTQSGGTITVGDKKAANNWTTHSNVGGYDNYAMTGGTMNVNEGGRLWIGSGDGKTPAAMQFKGGTLNLKGTDTNYAIVTTMTLGSFANADGTKYDQTLAFSGTNVNVDGSALLMSRDLQVSAGTIKVNADGKLYLLAEKQLDSDNKVLVNYTGDSKTWSKGKVTLKGGEIVVAEKGALIVAHENFAVEGGTVTNEGTISATKMTLSGGVVNTTAKGYETVVATDLNKGATLNLTALNSNQYLGLGKAKEEGKEYAQDQYLVFKGQTLNLNGGKLLANGAELEKMKVGAASSTGAVNVNADFSISELAIGPKGTVTVADDKTLTVGSKLYLTANEKSGNGIINSGTVIIKGAVVTPEGLAVKDMEDNVFVNNGLVYTGIDNVVTLTSDKETGKFTGAAITAFGSILNGDAGKVFESAERTITFDEYKLIQNAMDKLTMVNTTVTADKAGESLKWDEVSEGINSPSTTVTAEAAKDAKEVSLTVAANKTVVLENVAADYETVKIDAQGKLQLAGNNGVLFGDNVKTVSVSGTGFELGHHEKAGNSGLIKGEVALADKNTTVTIQGGTFTFGGLSGAGTVDVDGVLTTAYTGGDTTIDLGDRAVVAVVGNKPEAAAKVAAGAEAEPSRKTFEGAVQAGTVTFTGSESIFAVGVDAATSAHDVAVNYEDLTGKKVVYLTKQAVFSAAPDATDYLVNLGKVAATEKYNAEDGVMNNKIGTDVKGIKLVNLDATALSGKSGEKVLQFTTADAQSSISGVSVDFGNWFYGSSSAAYDGVAQSYDVKTGKIAFNVNEGVAADVKDMNLGAAAVQAAKDVVWGQNEIVDAIGFGTVEYAKAVKAGAEYKALAKQDQAKADAYFENQMGVYLDQLDIASELAVAGGAFNTALDVNDQVTGALERRTSLANLNAPRTTGFTPWVDVFGTTNEGKRIFGEGAGYEADLYGAVLGFDYTAACGGVLGLAVNVGQADANSVGLGVAKVDNDSDFYGVSIYGAQTFGDFNVKADFGYTQLSNDLSMAGVTKTWKESQDADVLTFGVGTEYLVKFGSVNVVPHAGLRVSRISVDDSKFGAAYDDLTVYQLPLGVSFSGTFDTNGWKVAPTVDVTFVPTFGDKNAEVSFIGGNADSVRVLDSNPVRATLGVAAQKDAWTFGVNYGLTAGSDDRLNNAFNANVRYSF